MKLVFYSGGPHTSNQVLHRELVRLTGRRRGASMTYIPFHHEGAGVFFGRAMRRYRRFGVSQFICLHADLPHSRAEVSRAFESDIVYLAGGNTFYFLKHLKRSGIFARLKRYARSGGVIAGLSAGALILTPTIRLAGHPLLDPDENDVKLKHLGALGLVPFEFAPHFYEAPREIRALGEYARRHRRPVIACADGSGLIVEGHTVTVHGRAYQFT